MHTEQIIRPDATRTSQDFYLIAAVAPASASRVTQRPCMRFVSAKSLKQQGQRKSALGREREHTTVQGS